jgi:2-keto-3-deoxy-L-rhamnonate aldolase RhmA
MMESRTTCSASSPPDSQSAIPPTLVERQRLRMQAHQQRKVSWGVHLSFLNADLVESCGMLGFHWLFLDGERTPITPFNCRDLVRAADLSGMFCVARVTGVNATEIDGYLDAGVLGISAPRISSAEEAKEFVAAVKLPARNRRRSANKATFAAVLIETRAAVEHLDEILQVQGVDYLAVGPHDLAVSVARHDVEHPEVKELLKTARQRLHASGRPLISVVTESRLAAEEIAQGATLVAVPDAALFAEAGTRFLTERQA